MVDKYLGGLKIMNKKPFVTKEQVEEIVKNILHHFIFMMKKDLWKMQEK